MLASNIDSLPFPSTLIFVDVDQDVLDAEDDAQGWSTAQSAPWLSYMYRMLPGEGACHAQP